MKRREFFKKAMEVSGLALVAPVLLSGPFARAAESRRSKSADTGPVMVDPKDATAKALEYVEAAKDNKKSKGNSCANCTLYVKTGTHKGKEIGTCAVFPGKAVYGPGYCNSWAKKA